MNELQDVDLFDVMKVEAFKDCNYGWEIHTPLCVLDGHKKDFSGQNIFYVIKNGRGVNLSSVYFRNDWACIRTCLSLKFIFHLYN